MISGIGRRYCLFLILWIRHFPKNLPQRLSASLSTSTRVHSERVADPKAVPSGRAVRDLDRLRVHCDHVGRCLTNCASKR